MKNTEITTHLGLVRSLARLRDGEVEVIEVIGKSFWVTSDLGETINEFCQSSTGKTEFVVVTRSGKTLLTKKVRIECICGFGAAPEYDTILDKAERSDARRLLLKSRKIGVH